MDLSWTTLHTDCDELASSIRDSGKEYETIVCVTRGGLTVGTLLSHCLGIRKILTISLKHYMNSERLEKIEELTPDLPKLEGSILVIDDLVDSGDTISYIKEKYGKKMDLDVAVLYDKGGGDIRPTYYVTGVDPKEWITFPWEICGD